MGLPSEAANLVILVYARQTNQTFSRHGGPYPFDIQSLGTLGLLLGTAGVAAVQMQNVSYTAHTCCTHRKMDDAR
jgi:hypothetical protein